MNPIRGVHEGHDVPSVLRGSDIQGYFLRDREFKRSFKMQSTRCILLVVAVVIASACAAPFVRRDGKPHIVAQRRYSSGYASGYASGGTGGKGGGGTPGAVNTATAITLTQTFTLDIVATTYTAGSAIRRTTEVTLLKLMNLFDATKSARNYAKDGCSISTSASRRAATITATTKVTPALKATAQAGATAFKHDPTLFTSKFNEAKALLGTTVTTPQASGVPGVTITDPNTTSGAASTSVSVFALMAAFGFVKLFQH
jgi:hypothetical protein